MFGILSIAMGHPKHRRLFASNLNMEAVDKVKMEAKDELTLKIADFLLKLWGNMCHNYIEIIIELPGLIIISRK